MHFCIPRYRKKAVIDSANPRSLDVYLNCLMLVDFIHSIIDNSAQPSMSISTLRKAITALILYMLFTNDVIRKKDKPYLCAHGCVELFSQYCKNLIIFYAYFFYGQSAVCLEGQRKCDTLVAFSNLSAAVYVKDAYIA